MTASPLDRARRFMLDVVRRQAQQIIELPYGFAALDSRFPHSYDHNKLVLTAAVDPAVALSDAGQILGGAGLPHRMISVPTGITASWADACVAAGYRHETDLVMAHSGAPPDRPADPQVAVEVVTEDDLREPTRQDWRAELPDADDDVIEQLVARRVTRRAAAPEVVFLAVRDDRGRIASRADLYLDPHQRVAQIEDVMTRPAHAGRGFARAIMADGLRRARAAGCDLVIVVADADDWPRHLYTRLGYAGIGEGHLFLRPPAP